MSRKRGHNGSEEDRLRSQNSRLNKVFEAGEVDDSSPDGREITGMERISTAGETPKDPINNDLRGPIEAAPYLEGRVVNEDVSEEYVEITYSIEGTSLQDNEAIMREKMGSQSIESVLDGEFEEVDVGVEERSGVYENSLEVTVSYQDPESISEGVYNANKVIETLDRLVGQTDLIE